MEVIDLVEQLTNTQEVIAHVRRYTEHYGEPPTILPDLDTLERRAIRLGRQISDRRNGHLGAQAN